MSNSKKNNISDIDTSFKKIDKIIEEISKENISIDKSVKLYEEGINTLNSLKKSIEKIEKKLEVLSEE